MLIGKPVMLPGRLTVCGISELDRFCAESVTHVLSILDPRTADPAAFGSFGEHVRTVLRFDDVVDEMPGFEAPQVAHLQALLAFGDSLSLEPEVHLLVHCHMGISRSTAAMGILLAQHNPGYEREAFATLLEIRPRCWPNSRMVAIADRLMGRHGALVRALVEHQREMLQRNPDLADLVAGVGRGHELPPELRRL